jgi:DNA-binding LytR/AlgR family response regulator
MFEGVWKKGMINTTLKYIIVDDEEIDRLAIEAEASKFPFLRKIASCAHPLEAFELVTQFSPDIIFLDIEMPDLSGLDLIKNKKIGSALPVLITSHPDYAVEGYELDAFDYLMKPLNAERFARTANRLSEFFQMRNKAFAFESEQDLGFIVIKQGHDKLRVPINEILYLEAMRDYTKIKTGSSQYLVLTTLSGILNKLPAELFVRIHRSYVVNREKVSAIEKSKIRIQSQTLPVGKQFKQALKLFLNT